MLSPFYVSPRGAINFAFRGSNGQTVQVTIRHGQFVRCQVCTTVLNRHRKGATVSLIVGTQLYSYCTNHGQAYLSTLV